MYCIRCGKEIGSDSRFCPYCGQEISGAINEEVKSEIRERQVAEPKIETNQAKASNDNSIKKRSRVVIALLLMVVVIGGGVFALSKGAGGITNPLYGEWKIAGYDTYDNDDSEEWDMTRMAARMEAMSVNMIFSEGSTIEFTSDNKLKTSAYDFNYTVEENEITITGDGDSIDSLKMIYEPNEQDKDKMKVYIKLIGGYEMTMNLERKADEQACKA